MDVKLGGEFWLRMSYYNGLANYNDLPMEGKLTSEGKPI